MGEEPPTYPTPPSPPGGMAASTPVPLPGLWIRPFERALLVTAVIAVGILALVGIVLILGSLNPGGVGRLLGVLAFLALFALTAAAALIPIRQGAAIGWIGLIASGLAFVLSLGLVLGSFQNETLAKAFVVVATLAWNVAFAALILALMNRHPVVDGLAWGTVVLLGVSFLLALIQLFGEIQSEAFAKLGVIVGILVVFGLIATPALARALAPGTSPPPA